MMISPEGYYEMHLRGEGPNKITSVIRGLKREISRLKNKIERRDYACMLMPSESTQLWCTRLYLAKAKEALVKVGGSYTPSRAERRAEKFDSSIPYISRIELFIGNARDGYETRVIKIDGDKIRMDAKRLGVFEGKSYTDLVIDEMDKESLLTEIAELHIGEWRRRYDPRRFGYTVLDGTHWHLYVDYSDGRKSLKIEGSNDYPWCFEELKELFYTDELGEIGEYEQK